MIEPLALMPAYLAAVMLKPAARSSKPFVVLNRNHDTITAMTSATTNPQWRRIAGRSRICGIRTKSESTFEIGWSEPSWRRKSERSPNRTIWAAT